MPGVARFGAAIASTIVLLIPAIWNRFPLLQYDTGGYLARWFEGYLVPSRSTVYGLFLVLSDRPDFWPAIVIQAALTVWMLALLLRVLGFGQRPYALLAVTVVLSCLTTLPFLTSILLTDIFAALTVLALHLLILCDTALHRWERNALLALVAFAVATHSATFAVGMALVSAAALAWGVFRIGSIGGIARGVGALALGALMLLTANLATSGRFVWTSGGIALSFGRMLQDGIVARYLHDHCPDGRMRLCAHRAELPTDADVFFWSGDGSLFNKLGRFDGLGDEMRAVVLGSLQAYPAWQVEAAAVATVRQLTHVSTGEGVLNTIWHTYWAIGKFTPQAAGDMRAARQQHGEFGFAIINRLHLPVALGSMLLLVPLMVWGARREPYDELSRLAATIGLALLANALVCGIFANPHDRYGARLVWLAPMAVLLTAWRLAERRKALSLPVQPILAPAGTSP